MNERVVFASLVALALVSGVSAQEDRNSYYYAEGQRVRVALAPNAIAVRFSTAPSSDLIARVGGQRPLLESKDERYVPLRRHRTVVYSVGTATPVTNQYLANLQEELMRENLPVADIGRVVTTETGSTAVLMAQLSIGFVDGVGNGLPDLRGLDADLQRSVTVLRTLNQSPLVVSYRVNANSARTALEIANEVYEFSEALARPLVIYAAPTLRFPAELRTVPNVRQIPDDDLFDQQWHLDSAYFANIDAPEAWDYTRGSSGKPAVGGPPCVVSPRVRIAVVDNGVQVAHPDLADNIVPGGRDYTVDPFGTDPNPGPFDPAFNPDPQHGTQAAGIIAACGNNDIGVSGVCPLCEILPLKINLYLSETANDALYDAKNVFGADVISNSWGGPASPELIGTLDLITGTSPTSAGIPVFFAVPHADADFCVTNDISKQDSVIAVSASSNFDQAGTIGGFGACLDLVAPTQTGGAGEVITTNVPSTYSNTTTGFGDTSASTAIVAGVAGLVLSLNPSLTQLDVRNILEHTAEKIPLLPSPSEMYVNGFNRRAGFGRVNAHRAVVPVVKITTTAGSMIQPNQPFDITVSASAPYLLSSIGWARKLQSCPGTTEEWRSVSSKAFHTETWSGLTLSAPGTYFFRPNAKDSKFPATDGYPHIASDAFPTLPEIKIVVQGTPAPPCIQPPDPETEQRTIPLPPEDIRLL